MHDEEIFFLLELKFKSETATPWFAILIQVKKTPYIGMHWVIKLIPR